MLVRAASVAYLFHPSGRMYVQTTVQAIYTALTTRGVVRGGHWAMAPPLGRQDSIFSIELHAKLRHAPPLC